MPEFSDCITDRASPLLAHARYLRREIGTDTGIVFVGPCIAKKREADVWNEIDCAITFGDLKKWLREAGMAEIPESTSTTGFYPLRAAKGALYPIDAA
jgi:iron only hydrogenase large subunit-like protein